MPYIPPEALNGQQASLGAAQPVAAPAPQAVPGAPATAAGVQQAAGATGGSMPALQAPPGQMGQPGWVGPPITPGGQGPVTAQVPKLARAGIDWSARYRNLLERRGELHKLSGASVKADPLEDSKYPWPRGKNRKPAVKAATGITLPGILAAAAPGAVVGGALGTFAGSRRGHAADGLARGVVRGGMTSANGIAGALMGGMAGNYFSPAGDPKMKAVLTALGAGAGGIGGGLFGYGVSGKLLGPPLDAQTEDSGYVGRPLTNGNERARVMLAPGHLKDPKQISQWYIDQMNKSDAAEKASAIERSCTGEGSKKMVNAGKVQEGHDVDLTPWSRTKGVDSKMPPGGTSHALFTAAKQANLSPLAQGFVRGCERRGLTLAQVRTAIKEAAAIDPSIEAELQPLLKLAGLGTILGKGFSMLESKAPMIGKFFGAAEKAAPALEGVGGALGHAAPVIGEAATAAAAPAIAKAPGLGARIGTGVSNAMQSAPGRFASGALQTAGGAAVGATTGPDLLPEGNETLGRWGGGVTGALMGNPITRRFMKGTSPLQQKAYGYLASPLHGAVAGQFAGWGAEQATGTKMNLQRAGAQAGALTGPLAHMFPSVGAATNLLGTAAGVGGPAIGAVRRFGNMQGKTEVYNDFMNMPPEQKLKLLSQFAGAPGAAPGGGALGSGGDMSGLMKAFQGMPPETQQQLIGQFMQLPPEGRQQMIQQFMGGGAAPGGAPSAGAAPSGGALGSGAAPGGGMMDSFKALAQLQPGDMDTLKAYREGDVMGLLKGFWGNMSPETKQRIIGSLGGVATGGLLGGLAGHPILGALAGGALGGGAAPYIMQMLQNQKGQGQEAPAPAAPPQEGYAPQGVPSNSNMLSQSNEALMDPTLYGLLSQREQQQPQGGMSPYQSRNELSLQRVAG